MWKIRISKKCLKELTKVPQHIRRRFEAIFLSSDDVRNPFDYQEFGARLEKLRGEENCYKVRLQSSAWRLAGWYILKQRRENSASSDNLSLRYGIQEFSINSVSCSCIVAS